MKLGGIIGAAVAGGAAGYANAMGQASGQAFMAELQRQRDEFLAQKQERLQALSQQFQSGESEKTREFEGTQRQMDRGQRTEEHDATLAHAYSSDAQHAQQHKETLASQEKIAGMHESAAERRHRESLDATGKNIQVMDDGRMAVIKGGKVIDYLRDPGTGEALTSQKDLSAQDKMRAATLTSLIKEENDLLAKSYDDEAKNEIRTRVRGYQSELGRLLGLNLGGKATGSGRPAGERKPLSSFVLQ